MNTRERPSDIMSQTPKQYHSTRCLTSSTNRIPCLVSERCQKTNQNKKNTPVLPTDKYNREVDVPYEAQFCTTSKDIHFICIRKQNAVTIKSITELTSSHFMWKVESLDFPTEHLCGYFLLLITKISKNLQRLLPFSTQSQEFSVSFSISFDIPDSCMVICLFWIKSVFKISILHKSRINLTSCIKLKFSVILLAMDRILT